MQQSTFYRDPIRRQLATGRSYRDQGAAVSPAPPRGSPRMTAAPAARAAVAGDGGVARIMVSGAVVSAAAVAGAALALLS